MVAVAKQRSHPDAHGRCVYDLYMECPMQSRPVVPSTGKKVTMYQCAPPGSSNFPALRFGRPGTAPAFFCKTYRATSGQRKTFKCSDHEATSQHAIADSFQMRRP